jgi:hypothetical protein
LETWHVDDDLEPQRGQLRVFGVGCASVLIVLATALLLRQQLWGVHFRPGVSRRAAIALLALAGACVAFALTRPQSLRRPYLTLLRATAPVGALVSWVMLAVLFFAIITPVGLLLRLVRKDPLDRAWNPDADSYWIPRRPAIELRRYFRQY